MSNWSPEQQITALKFGAYSALFASGIFATKLATNIYDGMAWQGTTWISGFSVLFAICFVVTAIVWSMKNRSSGGWREILGIYSEEYAREVNSKANNYGFISVLLLLVPAFILGDSKMIAKIGGQAPEIINLSNFVLLMLLVSGVVWSLTVLFNLRDEGNS